MRERVSGGSSNRRSSLSKVGIEVRGRSRRPRINYRTTHELLRWSLAVLGEGDFDDLDTGTDMAVGLAEQVIGWIDDGVEPSEIGVAARAQGTFAVVERELRKAGVPCFRLGRDLKFGDGVALGTMHRMKGLEYRCMALAAVGANQVPSPTAIAVAGDATEMERETRRERCLLYVACTRAREDLWVGYSGEPSPFLGRTPAED